ncbi:histone chaperone asf1 [Danaus plexippus]|uniref:Histone chaperone asf1 n=1 Tax=Danaus plexippus plexippus TaxID=278856 RepID=A0A212FA81_DANPL|nr:histone chaperone asf1 [Danaus plexippus]OWR50641.1 Histone chaperone asf1 [Danaus plexippus plexippus]
MAKVHITNVVVLDNPSPFLNPFQFELTFECIEELKEDLEWKMIYVGSAETEEHDQVLDTIYVGPIPEGRHMFVFQAPPPDVNRIPENDALGVTVVLLTCSYRGQEFVRVGYFINNEYSDSEPELRENPPAKPQFDKVVRNILASEPRVTRFKINWAEPDSAAAVDSGDGNLETSHAPSNDSYAFNADSQISGMEFQGSFSGYGDNSNSIAPMEC